MGRDGISYSFRLGCGLGLVSSIDGFLDFDETFAPTRRSATGRALLALSVQLNWKRTRVDVEAVFLQPTVDKIMWIEPPPGLVAEIH